MQLAVVDTEDPEHLLANSDWHLEDGPNALGVRQVAGHPRVLTHVIYNDWLDCLRHQPGDALTRTVDHARQGLGAETASCARNEMLVRRIPDHDRGLVGAEQVRRHIDQSLQHLVQLERSVQGFIRAIQALDLARALLAARIQPGVVDRQRRALSQCAEQTLLVPAEPAWLAVVDAEDPEHLAVDGDWHVQERADLLGIGNVAGYSSVGLRILNGDRLTGARDLAGDPLT
jgi:hypothetical protein